MARVKSDQNWMEGQADEDIVTVGDPRLRAGAQPVVDLTSVRPLCGRMVELLRKLNGAGLAAPQIGVGIRVVVVEVRRTDLFPDRPESPLRVMINPIIVESSSDTDLGWEGCFSVPGLMGKALRHDTVTVTYQDPSGAERRETMDGYLACVVQHECDHLDGRIFLDRMSDMESLTTVRNYMRLHG